MNPLLLVLFPSFTEQSTNTATVAAEAVVPPGPGQELPTMSREQTPAPLPCTSTSSAGEDELVTRKQRRGT